MNTVQKPITITSRGIIVHEGKLLVFKLRPTDDWYSLPGGKMDFGEPSKANLERELFEETAVEAKVGKLLFVHELIQPEIHRIEFFYWIENAADYLNTDLEKAEFGFEVAEVVWVDIANPQLRVLPEFVLQKLPAAIQSLDEWGIEVVTNVEIDGKL